MMNEPLIRVENLTKIYRIGAVDFPALVDVNLEIENGEFISIMGPSGSGKSTLLNILGALDRPTAGRVLVEGFDLFQRDDNQLAEFRNMKLGFIFQAHNLLARTSVLANVALPGMIAGESRAKRRERARELLELVGLGDKVTRKPMELSGGEQQRVAVARALINYPLIVLGDEPTGNLDSKTGAEIVAMMKRIKLERGTAFVLVTHNPEVASETERVIHLRDGRVTQETREGVTFESKGDGGQSQRAVTQPQGQALSEPLQTVPKRTQPSVTHPELKPPTQTRLRYCIYCGNKISPTAAFCSRCGKGQQ
jgi:putative ABC transport system ATP-binding protein